MMICICTKCRFTFRSPLLPVGCPDCGEIHTVRKATPSETEAFYREEKILAAEIKKGLYGPALS